MLFAFILAIISYGTAGAATVKQVSTGAETACAVVGGKVKCWGEGGSGQLGNRSTSSSTAPVDVYAVKDPAPIRPSPCGGWFQPSCTPIEQPSSPLGGRVVSKVSVGTDHACAIASARVYCWGDNSRGQLGNRSNDRSTMPVVVDVQAQDVTPEPVRPNPCGGWFQPSCTAVAQPTKPKSAIGGGKEIVDVAAGEYFTCALASDGSVACWGEGDNGRLGTNATTDVNYPKAVYVANGSALQNKKGLKLAKAAGATMCVTAVDANSTESTAGQAYCWGQGIDGGQAMPANASADTACNKNSPTVSPSATTKATIYTSTKPVLVSGVNVTAIDGQDYITALGADNKAYYWGMYGHQESVTYANVKTCRVNPCTGTVTIQQDVELAGWKTKSDKTNRPRNSGPVNNRPKQTSQTTNGRTRVTNYSDGGQKVEVRDRNNGTSSNSCSLRTHYSFTKNTAYTNVGEKTTTIPSNWPQSQAGITALSGNANNDLFCAATAAGAKCDGHGSSVKAGQTGSGYTEKCTTRTVFIFLSETICEPAPTGPQNVVANGALAGKQITQLNTGKTGYTCALAGGSVNCWGVNTKGQLGVGDKNSRNVPTGVAL